MMYARINIVGITASVLSKAATIAIRYNAVRKQCFQSSTAKSFRSPEVPLIDYKFQQYRLFKHLSVAYSFRFTALWMLEQTKMFEGEKATGKVLKSEGLQELAVTSGGLKALNSYEAMVGVEELRKCCGGNGYLMSSGISNLVVSNIW